LINIKQSADDGLLSRDWIFVEVLGATRVRCGYSETIQVIVDYLRRVQK